MLPFFRPEKSTPIRPLASIDFTKNKSAKTVIKPKMIYRSGFVFATLFNSPIDTEHVMEIRHSCLRIRIENKNKQHTNRPFTTFKLCAYELNIHYMYTYMGRGARRQFSIPDGNPHGNGI